MTPSPPGSIGVWILGDQLHPQQAALASLAASVPERIPVILIESSDWANRRNYHQQKLVLVWSAMRHFAQELQNQGYPVTYVESDGFAEPLQAWAQQHQLQQIRLMQPADLPFRSEVDKLGSQLPCPILQIENNHFLWTSRDFINWAAKRKRLLMEDFYREGRKRFRVLMDGSKPLGGRWNYDRENRKPPKAGIRYPTPLHFLPDALTQAVIHKVKQHYGQHFGSLAGFGWAVTRSQALQVLEHFIKARLPHFGPWQDAMQTGEDFLYHSLLSPYLNLGLLTPHEVVAAAEAAYHQGGIPIASAEGFIRQILGWREYMRGLYEYLMPTGYSQQNFFNHTHPLPDFFWTTDTDLNCLRQTLQQIHRHGYAHHIQRLMILSNFALISGIQPQAVEAWFHDVFIDSYDWVMQTNVIGMGLFADGGMLASKPYAASAQYIHKMSDYCRNCRYNHSEKVGAQACPFNTFYWDFLLRHRPRLASLGRMGLVLAHLERMKPELISQIQAQATAWWEHLQPTSDQQSPSSAQSVR
ncbi:cryptochrome/photolyase family protein [Thermostichus vulcanus]|uniref:Cryptochrome/photolyase family protein n=1 Tax=Thermostichus vulcanus str. 'Rupite' TaxID=2813851 RepID=A0ABT0C9P9_THEVL|nr:cryptochrome/photolyase family protein [Thermostichus vulcanus]MCJ2542506.1 cryptochrome/photolyase family protein [Thermostichus vulcanus str. 'Rupite']